MNNKKRGWRKRGFPPDVLYHATSQKQLRKVQKTGQLFYSSHKSIYCSRTEDHAWQIAHRSFTDPAVAIIDVPKARRNRVYFSKNKRNLWQIDSLDKDYIINVHPNFDEQVSAGGIPIYYGPDGPKVALIQVRRAFSLTWEIAKGKLEIGETPQQAAVREISEEMGVHMRVELQDCIGVVRFVMYTPAGHPRLKTLYLYLLKSFDYPQEFTPAIDEGVEDVQWFDIDTAVTMVSHRSLFSVMKKLKEIVSESLE